MILVDLSDWLNLALRWIHLITGIAWIGSSFYFVWLDNHLKPPAGGAASGELWSVHGGGFYHKQKYNVAPGHMPAELHWHKWEAYSTWISGFSLLVLVYFLGARSFLIDPAKARIEPSDAVAIGLFALAAGWAFYDLLCRSPLGRNDRLVGIVWFGFLVLAAMGLDHLFVSRGAYLMVGAMVGTVMVANVFFIIIPNQRKAVTALIAGQVPDPALGKAGKQRSLHNNYMTLPVLFIMISHHYPMTYGAQRPWLVLALLSAMGVAIRHVFNLRHRGRSPKLTILVALALALASVLYVGWDKAQAQKAAAAAAAALAKEQASAPTYAAIAPILARHCATCHSAHPTDPAVSAPPLGVLLDSYDHASAVAARIRTMAVDTETMPLGNPTGMTSAERAQLGAWIAAGAQP
jgi:uncharacterized membrane protein